MSSGLQSCHTESCNIVWALVHYTLLTSVIATVMLREAMLQHMGTYVHAWMHMLSCTMQACNMKHACCVRLARSNYDEDTATVMEAMLAAGRSYETK
eukprot:scaffold177708_cov36-Tisochrysis_lutea.AAC.1